MAKQKNRKTPTTGDKLAQQWRNRQAMFRVYEAARAQRTETENSYWTPLDIRTLNM